MNTITAITSVYMLSIAGLFDTPIRLQGFAADAAFAGDNRQPVEAVMGVDGLMSVGYKTSLYKQKISLMPDSPVYDIFEQWLSAMEATQEVYVASAQIVIPGIGRQYVCTKGVMTQGKPIPDVKKVLQASEWEITWQSITGVNV